MTPRQLTMKYRNDLLAEYVCGILNYNPKTGEFRRKVDRSSNAKKGQLAGSTHSEGYLVIQIDGKAYKSHRLAFLIMKNRWPDEQIDHINEVKTDNRWCNLREATRSQNSINIRKNKRNRSGYRGVSWYPALNKWVVQIQSNNKKITLGYYEDIKEAALAYNEAATKYHGEFAILNKLEEFHDDAVSAEYTI